MTEIAKKKEDRLD